jgi:peptide/nickel transport system permease protein
VLGILLITVFSIHLHWFPPSVVNGTQIGILGPLFDMVDNWRSFVLPTMVLVGLTVGGFTRYMRGSVLDALVQDYVRTARAKGASPRRLLFGHAFRNAIIPILTLLGLSLPALFSGALITETLFNYPGMGFLTVGAISNNDIFLVMGTTLVIAIFTIIGSLLADLMVAVADPRVRLMGRN